MNRQQKFLYDHPLIDFLMEKAEKAALFCVKVWAAILVWILFYRLYQWLGWL